MPKNWRGRIPISSNGGRLAWRMPQIARPCDAGDGLLKLPKEAVLERIKKLQADMQLSRRCNNLHAGSVYLTASLLRENPWCFAG
jgi:hypothetical protein